jgi:hypothetical protein
MNRTCMAIVFVALVLIPSLLFAECFNYEPDLTTLTGKIIRKTFPGPPNYESIKDGDEPETYWILVLDKPFCVNGKKGDIAYSLETKIEQVQLVFMAASDEYKKYKNLVGENVIVRGQLFPMQTGHHHTNVLITVKDITMGNK